MSVYSAIIAVVLAIVSYVITALTTPKPKAPDVPNYKDFQFPVPDEGAPQAVIFGDCWTPDWQVLYVGNYRTEEIRGGAGKKG